MIGRIFLFFFFSLFAIFIATLHHLTTLFMGADRFNIAIVVVLFINILFDYPWALALGVVSGFMLDQLSFTPAQWSISIVVTLLVTNFLFIHFFTNRSLWTLVILGGVGTTLAFIIHMLLIRSFALFFSLLGVQLMLHTILFVILFYCMNMFTSRLKPYMLIRS